MTNTPEPFNPELWNQLFAENGCPEASNCETQEEALRAVRFIMGCHQRKRDKLDAIKKVINGDT